MLSFATLRVFMAVVVLGLTGLEGCKEETFEPSIPVCTPVKAISAIPMGCNPLVQLIRAHGSGTDGTWRWTLYNCYSPHYPHLRGTTISTLTPELLVEQDDPDVPCTIQVEFLCAGIITSSKLFKTELNLPDWVNSPGEIFITGPTEVTRGGIRRYEFDGSWRLNGNAVRTYVGVNSARGIITNDGYEFIDVHWHNSVPGATQGWVRMDCKNNCSNKTATRTLPVTVFN